MAKLTLLEELQEAHAKGDHKTMLEIGQKLAANDKEFDRARKDRRTAMERTVAEAKAIADPDDRTKALLAAFRFCVQEACAADAESRDIETYNVGVRQLGVISDALRNTPLNRFAELAQFLDDPDIELRGFAAVWLRKVMPERTLPILKEIDKFRASARPSARRSISRSANLSRRKNRAARASPAPNLKFPNKANLAY